MRLARSLCWVLLWLLLSLPVMAGEGAADARELCRIIVSGSYLGYLNDLDVLKHNLTKTSASVFSMKANHSLALKQLQTLDQKHEQQKTPAAELDEELLGIKYQIETMHEEIRDSEARMHSLKDQIAVKERDFIAFKTLATAVFAVVNAKIVNQGAYPVVLQYRQLCNQYEQLCPLSSPYAQALLTLAKQLEDGTHCVHYASMSK